jgi:hypothetical protein
VGGSDKAIDMLAPTLYLCIQAFLKFNKKSKENPFNQLKTCQYGNYTSIHSVIL